MIFSAGAFLFLAAILAVLYSNRPRGVACHVFVRIDGRYFPSYIRSSVMPHIFVGKTAQASATAAASDPSVVLPHLDYVWSSSHPEFATIDASGLITAIAVGLVTFTATVSTPGYIGSGTADSDIVVPADVPLTVTVNIAPNP